MAPPASEGGDASDGRPALLVVAPSAELYGSDRALLNGLPELVASYNVTIAYPADGPAIEHARALGAETVVLPDYALRRRHLRPAAVVPWLVRVTVAVVRLTTLHRRRRFALIYSNTLAAFVGAPLRLLWRTPHVLHVHEYPYQRSWFPKVLFLVARLTTELVICNSNYMRSLVTEHQPKLAARSVTVHNGMNLPARSRPPAPSTGSLRVVCVGRIHPKKGQPVLVEAARLARAQGSAWELHFFGDTLPEYESLYAELRQSIATAGLAEITTFHGFVPDLAALYLDADVAVVPSVFPEEFSLVCAEAQALEVPVVATGPGGPSEVLRDGETGIIVPPNDPAALAAAIRRLEADPEERGRMGQLGRQRVLAEFSRQTYGVKLRAECDDLLRRWPSHRPPLHPDSRPVG